MATDNSTENKLSAENLEFLNDQRIEIARQASCDIEGLSSIIIKMGVAIGDDDVHAVRSIAVRIKQLSCIIMSAVNDAVENEAELSYKLLGVNNEPAQSNRI